MKLRLYLNCLTLKVLHIELSKEIENTERNIDKPEVWPIPSGNQPRNTQNYKTNKRIRTILQVRINYLLGIKTRLKGNFLY